MDKNNYIGDFYNPPAEFRGAPFWSWNAKLSPERLREQINIMKKMGMGGFFMHSRVGLKTPYLEKEWFDCVAACVDEAKKTGLSAWLYDEDRWPSGAAGGIVTANDKFKMKELLMEKAGNIDDFSNKGTTLSYFAAYMEDNKVLSYKRVSSTYKVQDNNEVIIRCYFDYSAKSSDFNGETYLDTLNEEAVKKFIEVTHEAYYQKFGDDFGKTIPGIFTDEPCFALPYRGDVNLPWTLDLEVKFQEKYGYNLLDGLIELYFDCGNEVSCYRHDYYNLITELFVNAFAKQIGLWCKEHNILFTGHILWEDELDGQTAYIGNAMRFYEHMQIPGIDLLTEHWTTYATAKQCTSVARQFGKKRRLSELYGCTGWDFPLMGHKSLGDWQYAMGINFRCHHLYWYSMEAEAKRDYPASISEHSPWHLIYSKIENHFARLGSILSRGDEIRDILVIHPIESVWSVKYRISKEWVPAVSKLNQEFIDLSNLLLSANLDYDYADEALLSSYGTIEEDALVVGCAKYKAVVIPELKTIRSSTLAILEKFALAGGKVYYLGGIPEYIDAIKSSKCKEVFTLFTVVDEALLVESLSNLCRRVSLKDKQGNEIAPLLYHFSKTDKNFNLFVCNTGVEPSNQPMAQPLVRDRNLTFFDVDIEIAAENGKLLYEFDTLDGEIYKIPFKYQNGKYSFSSSFEELTSKLFVLSCEEIIQAKEIETEVSLVNKIDIKDDNLKFLLDEPNVFILDHANLVIDDIEVKKNEFILLLDDFLRRKLGKEPRGGHMVQPYLQKDSPAEKILDIELIYSFECDEVPVKDCLLALEHPELYHIFINGKLLEQVDCGQFIDPVLRKIKLPVEFLLKGKNQLSLQGKYHDKLSGLESIYILGEFGVFDDKIGEFPASVAWGNWCEQGFPYYGGNFTYLYSLEMIKGEKSFISIPDWSGTAIGIKVNNSEEKVLFSPPYKIEITSMLKQNDYNKLEICVYGHRRNLFGPFFSKEKWPVWTGPGQFKLYESKSRQLVPCGVITKPYIEV